MITSRTSILNSIDEYRGMKDRLEGTVLMNPKSVEEWAALLRKELEMAERHASYGQNTHAMNSIFRMAGQCVGCLEEHGHHVGAHRPDHKKATAPEEAGTAA